MLSGLSIEVTLYKARFVTPAEKQYSYWNDDLTENEIAIIIGTYISISILDFISIVVNLGFLHPLFGIILTVASGGWDD